MGKPTKEGRGGYKAGSRTPKTKKPTREPGSGKLVKEIEKKTKLVKMPTTQKPRHSFDASGGTRMGSSHLKKQRITIVYSSGKHKYSKFVDIEVELKKIKTLTLKTEQQKVDANDDKDLHNGALHAQHGKVTYLQQVKKGGFFVRVGNPEKLSERYFGAGSFVGFIDVEGPGHGSRVGPKGVERTFRLLKGHLSHRQFAEAGPIDFEGPDSRGGGH